MSIARAGTSKLAVFIGRFQPFHLGHAEIVAAALQHCEKLVILVGSAYKSRSTYNPFTFDERKAVIMAALGDDQKDRVLVLPLRDSEYNNAQWTLTVQKAVAEASETFFGEQVVETTLVGHNKDHTSFYLKMFPQWGAIDVVNYKMLSATPLRESYFIAGGLDEDVARAYMDEGILAPSTVAFLHSFAQTEIFKHLVAEYRYIEAYKEPYKALPYPPVFVCVDAVVVQSGHVLMIKRRARPGKGLLALPGGFVESNQTIEQAVYAELEQETGLSRSKVGSWEKIKVFDDPHRSARGRTITHAALFRLPDAKKFPSVTSKNDPDRGASKPQWIEISQLTPEMCFEDHFAMIHNLLETFK